MISLVVPLVSSALFFVLVLIYWKSARMLMQEIAATRKSLAAARERTAGIIPGLKEGTAATFRINRKTMQMFLDEDQALRIGMPKSEWGVPEFRGLCHSDSYDVFDKWINTYSRLYNPICRRLRFHISYDDKKSFHWFELIYKLDEVTSKTTWFRGVFIGIDHIKEMENAIEDAMKKVYVVEGQENLLAAVNHDLRTPLNAVAGFARLLVEQYEDFSPEERHSFADIVQENGEVMLQLLSDVCQMREDGDLEFKVKMRRKSVTELMALTYQTNKVICPAHLGFYFQGPDNSQDKFINIDPKRTQQVLNNFLSNAFKFTQAGAVTLGWDYNAETQEVELYVQDTGVGIQQEYIDKVFDQYFKVHEHAHGTGLGLNTSKSIVEMQGGTIGVSSVYGQGSRFFCRFKTL